MKHLIQTLAKRLGYQFIRLDTLGQLRAQLAASERDLAGYKAAYDYAETGRVGYKSAYEQTCAELGGYRSAYDQTSAELARYRKFLQQSRRVGAAVRPFGFLHLQKTGGISLLDFLGRQFEQWRVLWVFSPRELEQYHPNELTHYDLICGHFSFSNVAQIRPGRVLCTFLRHPVERVLSCYWYFRTYQGATRDIIRAGVAAAKTKSLKEFLRDSDPEVRFHTVNHQTHALSGDWTAPGGATPALTLAAAVRNLDAFACVGLTERMEESVDLFCRVMGWQRGGPLDRLNQTVYRQQANELSAQEHDLILELNSLDLTLYERARDRLNRDLGSAPATGRRAA
jgi:hypothetical protein